MEIISSLVWDGRKCLICVEKYVKVRGRIVCVCCIHNLKFTRINNAEVFSKLWIVNKQQHPQFTWKWNWQCQGWSVLLHAIRIQKEVYQQWVTISDHRYIDCLLNHLATMPTTKPHKICQSQTQACLWSASLKRAQKQVCEQWCPVSARWFSGCLLKHVSTKHGNVVDIHAVCDTWMNYWLAMIWFWKYKRTSITIRNRQVQ